MGVEVNGVWPAEVKSFLVSNTGVMTLTLIPQSLSEFWWKILNNHMKEKPAQLWR